MFIKLTTMSGLTSYYANDANKYVIALFYALQQGWQPPLTITREHIEYFWE